MICIAKRIHELNCKFEFTRNTTIATARVAASHAWILCLAPRYWPPTSTARHVHVHSREGGGAQKGLNVDEARNTQGGTTARGTRTVSMYYGGLLRRRVRTQFARQRI